MVEEVLAETRCRVAIVDRDIEGGNEGEEVEFAGEPALPIPVWDATLPPDFDQLWHQVNAVED
jgi:hypothetical protein